MYVSYHMHFFLVLLLNQRWSTPLRLQASHCSTFRIMCDVPSIAVFCSESIEWFPGIVSKFFFKLLVTIPVAAIITGTIVHFRFHIRCISIHKLLYFNFFSASFCTTFLSVDIATSISVHAFSSLFFNYYIWPICCNLYVCVYCLIPQHCYYYYYYYYVLAKNLIFWHRLYSKRCYDVISTFVNVPILVQNTIFLRKSKMRHVVTPICATGSFKMRYLPQITAVYHVWLHSVLRVLYALVWRAESCCFQQGLLKATLND